MQQNQTFGQGMQQDLMPKTTIDPDGVLSGYQPSEIRYDELLNPEGSVRSTWQPFANQLESIGRKEFSRRWNHSQRLIYENGLSYSPYGELETNARPWELDAFPFLIEEAEWNQVSAGIVQRAELLQLVLKDFLGPQRLISEGVIPAQLLFGHSGFRIPYHGVQPSEGSFIDFYAADLGKDAQGRWWVMADRTEAPSGVGFALENRVVISRMLPEIFRHCQVQRLAPFFISLKSRLHELAQHVQKNPRVVLYTRGPEHENYFEDAYLARYLGIGLVEGGDLAVQDNKVWLKTLEGLIQVDVLWRRPNSEHCDPLEFEDHSLLGIAGLLKSVRSSQVAMANPLGSGLVESPAIMAFLPRLCKFFLGQELLIPGIATYWCGEASSLERVLANIEHYIISPAYRSRGSFRVTSKQLSSLSPDELRAKIQQNPERFVAQERIPLSTVPCWKDNETKQSSLVLRSFAVANQGSYHVMPGGLARTSDPDDSSPYAVPASQGSKDAWVLSTKPVKFVSLLSSGDEQIAIRRTGADLPSRVADNIYWLGRHIERTDAAARQLRTLILRLTSETSSDTRLVTSTLIRSLAAQGQFEPSFVVSDLNQLLPKIDTILPQLVFDRKQPGSLRVQLDQLFRTSSLVRDRLSPDCWRVLVRIDQKFQLEGEGDLTDLIRLLNALVVDIAAIEGLCMESMTRSYVFRFLDLGRRLERALQAVGMLQACLVDTQKIDAEILEALLDSADSVMTYRSRYLAKVQLPPVLDLLLTDVTNPRSVAYQLATLQQHIEELPGQQSPIGYSSYERLVQSMMHSLRMLDVVSLAEMPDAERQAKLGRLLTNLDRELQKLSREISNHYLVHTSKSRRMASTPSSSGGQAKIDEETRRAEK